jgi:uridine kinase
MDKKIYETLLPRIKNGGVVAIDGRCASGKTTLAGLLAEITGAGIVYMDDFFLPAELRTPERFAKPGGNIHHERFLREVSPFLRKGVGFSYQIFDCKSMDFVGKRQVPPSSLIIVEGAYSHHPLLGDYADIRVFSDIDPVTQIERIKQRNGETAADLFIQKWIPLEEEYFQTYQILRKADMVI